MTALLNPVQFAARVNEQFLHYQLPAHPLAEHRRAEQARELVRGKDFEAPPLVKGPYLSKPFLLVRRRIRVGWILLESRK